MNVPTHCSGMKAAKYGWQVGTNKLLETNASSLSLGIKFSQMEHKDIIVWKVVPISYNTGRSRSLIIYYIPGPLYLTQFTFCIGPWTEAFLLADKQSEIRRHQELAKNHTASERHSQIHGSFHTSKIVVLLLCFLSIKQYICKRGIYCSNIFI